MLKIKCKHCGYVNQRDYGEMRSDLMGNHFYKFKCANQECKKRNLVRYALEVLPIQDEKSHETTKQIVEKKIIK